jgi:hypothetical protein
MLNPAVTFGLWGTQKQKPAGNADAAATSIDRLLALNVPGCMQDRTGNSLVRQVFISKRSS